MYYFNDYVFDPQRLLIYRENIDKDTIDKINSSYDYKHIIPTPYDLKMNPDKMQMDNIAIDRAGICLTYNCNLRCRYCGYSSNERSAYRLQLEDVEEFVRDIIMRRTIKVLITKKNEPLAIDFTGGGEPTYDWTLFEKSVCFIKDQCAQNNIPVSLRLTTNGMLSNQQINFISNNFSHVMISYDGIPEIQNRNRISPYRNETNLNVEKTIQQLAVNRVPLTIRSTIWRDDLDKIIDMYNHVFSIVPPESVVTWSIYPVLFEGRAVTRIKRQEDPTYSSFFKKCIDLIKYIRAKGDVQLKTLDVPLFNNNICDIFCGAHRVNQPWLLPDKSIVTCMESKDGKTIIGKISDGKVHYYENYQDPLLKIVQKKYVECQECIAYSTCKGGCPIWHLRVDGDIQEPLECCLQKEYWKYVVNSLVSGEYSLGWKIKKIVLPKTQNQEIYKVVKE